MHTGAEADSENWFGSAGVTGRAGSSTFLGGLCGKQPKPAGLLQTLRPHISLDTSSHAERAYMSPSDTTSVPKRVSHGPTKHWWPQEHSPLQVPTEIQTGGGGVAGTKHKVPPDPLPWPQNLDLSPRQAFISLISAHTLIPVITV